MDLRLGARMLVKYPGLTVVGSLALAFAIAAGALAFEVVTRVVAPTLPLPEGERMVGFKFLDRAQGEQRRISSYDFLNFREHLGTVREISAYRLRQQNLRIADRMGEPITVTEMSASAFSVARVSAFLGRTLVEADEAPGSPAVAVLGYELWQARFAGDRGVLGQEVRVGDRHATVVGVMPEGFSFPVDDHFWMPLRAAELSREPGGEALQAFGRLAPGASLAEAEAETAALVARGAMAWPQVYAQLTPQVLPYAESVRAIPAEGRIGIFALNLFAVFFLVVVCGNVALLMFARAATREKELLVRTALGATRGRLVGMLFLEALALAAIATIIGLVAAHELLRATVEALRAGPDRWPFWLEGGISFTTVLYAGLLAVLAAAIAGVVPALKVMGKRLWDRMRQSGAGGGGLRMGGVWTGVIIAQIAATVLFTAVAFVVHRQAVHIAAADADFPAEKFLSMRLEMERPGAEKMAEAERSQFQQRYTAAVRELERQLRREPLVAKVALAEQLPRMPGPGRRIEMEENDPPGPTTRGVQLATVDLGFFAAFEMPVVAGRSFDSRDLGQNANTVIVNSTFVEQVLHGRSAVGRRLRYQATRSSDAFRAAEEPGPWLEIVGVVRDSVWRGPAPLNLDNPTRPRLYRPLGALLGDQPLHLAVRGQTGIEPLVPLLRRLGGEVSPDLRLHEMQSLAQATNEDARFWTVFAKVVLAGSAFTLGLSLAGIYAVMSFTVSRRTREIGVRTALGGGAGRVIGEIFRRPFRQVVAGVAVGWLILASVVTYVAGGSMAGFIRHAPLLLGHGIAVVLICGLACLGPILKALRVQPIEALREEG